MIGCIIQARLGSSRLPGKILRNIEKNRTVLDFQIDQLQYSKLMEKMLIVTTTQKEDDKIIRSNGRQERRK